MVMASPLGYVYSRADALKRQLYDMITNPRDYASMLGGRIVEGGQEREALMNQAFADPSNPLKITNEKALAALTDKIMQGEMGMAQLGMVKPEQAAKVLTSTKVVNDSGNPLRVYHGTPDAFESQIKGESYFSPDPEIAGMYTSPTASSIATFAKRGDAPAVYPSYLDIKKPFDTRDPKIRKEFMEEYYGKYGNRTPLSDSGLPDWTEARDLREWIQETGKKYDGLILDEGGIPMPDGTVKSRGISYVPFESSQIKSAVSDPVFHGLLAP